jgi:hypothetical protein
MRVRTLLPLFMLGLAIAPGRGADAAPRKIPVPTAQKPTTQQPTFGGTPTRVQGKSDARGMGLPTKAERHKALSAIDPSISAVSMSWAAVSPRKPFKQDRAALVFAMADAVNTRSGIASWGPTGSAVTPEPSGNPNLDALACLFTNCDGDPPTRALQVWINATAGKKYSAVCRVKIANKVGDVAISSDTAAVTHHVDHTGKSSGSVGFFLDPSESGWYGFVLRSADAWSTSGCTIDELQ